MSGLPNVLWFLLAVLLGLLFLPREAVMWGLVVVAVGMILYRFGPANAGT